MLKALKHCNYCIRKAIDDGELDTVYAYEPDKESLKEFDRAFPVYDNHGIFVFYSCEKCDEEQRSRYDPVIFNDYKVYERKVSEYGERFEPDE
jgi:hypothetical protein